MDTRYAYLSQIPEVGKHLSANSYAKRLKCSASKASTRQKHISCMIQQTSLIVPLHVPDRHSRSLVHTRKDNCRRIEDLIAAIYMWNVGRKRCWMQAYRVGKTSNSSLRTGGCRYEKTQVFLI